MLANLPSSWKMSSILRRPGLFAFVFLGLGALGLIYTNMGTAVDYQTACLSRPRCERVLNAILQARLADSTGTPLSPGELLQIAANRFGYGLSSAEPDFQPDRVTSFAPYQIAYILTAQMDGVDPTLVGANFSTFESNLELALSEGYVSNFIKRQPPMTSLTSGFPCLNSNFLLSNGSYRMLNVSTRTVLKNFAEVSRRRDQCDQDVDGDGTPDNLTGPDKSRVRNAIETVSAHTELMRGAFGSQYVHNGVTRDLQMNLRQVLHEFWFNRFNVDYQKVSVVGLGDQSYERVITDNQMTSFRQLLGAVIKSPAMLRYLDNNGNTFDSATNGGMASNQNLGRELLELHSFGVGPQTPEDNSPYNQIDVEVAAMVLTGHSFDDRLDVSTGAYTFGYRFDATKSYPTTFKLRKRFWDNLPTTGRPLFFNSGRLDTLDAQTPVGRLEALLDMVSANSFTHRSVCKALSLRFVRPELLVPVRDNCVAALSATPQGDLRSAYTAILTSNEVWSRNNYQPLIANPLEIVTKNVRATGIKWTTLFKTTELATSSVRVFSLAQFMENAINAHGLSYKSIGPPTGYEMQGVNWLSQGYVINATRFAFQYANLDRMLGLQMEERLFTQSASVKTTLAQIGAMSDANVPAATRDLLYKTIRSAATTTPLKVEQALDIKDIINQPDLRYQDLVPDALGVLNPSLSDTALGLGKLNRYYFSK